MPRDQINKGDFIFHDDGPFRVCVFSRIMKEKGIEDAINAVVDINKKSKNHRILLDIYGQIDKKQIEWFERLRRTFPDYITYKGEIDNRDTNHILKNYYLTLFPTHFYTEGIPGTVIDSLFAGVPVLASNWENFDDILKEGYNGYSFKFNNYEDFLDKLVWCLNNPKIINKMKYNCLQSADHFSSTEAIQTIKKVVDRTYGK